MHIRIIEIIFLMISIIKKFIIKTLKISILVNKKL
jgi:hypothetical protein